MRSRTLTILLGTALTATACGASPAGGGNESEPEGPVTISVGCQPPKTNKGERKQWNEDVEAFQKLNPNITIESKDAFPCINPDTFQAKLAGGQMEDVFYVYYTDIQNIIKRGQAADISKYVNDVKLVKQLRPDVAKAFSANGKLYGLPRTNYAMGLVYNRKLFEKAGLDPSTPPATWADVHEAAKKISALGDGHVGFGEYSAGNTGGWHFAASLYGRGGEMVSADGKKAAFNSPEGQAVLDNLKKMRWTDNSMGTKQLHQWEDLMRMMGGGKLGMMIGAADLLQALNNDFGGDVDDYVVAPLPEAKASLSGGDGYLFNPKASPAQIKAGLKWLEYRFLTPGKGQFDYARSKADKLPVGHPDKDFYGAKPAGQELNKLREANATVPTENYTHYVKWTQGLEYKMEPPKAQELYAIIDKAMSAVLTRKDADSAKLLAEAEQKANRVLARP